MTLLAWATETMTRQLGFGDEVPAAALSTTPEMLADQKFVPADADSSVGGTLEVRSDAIVTGSAVKLKQICRWSEGEAAVFAPVADLTIAHIPDSQPFHVVTIQDIRQTLHDAGVNIALINFAGAISCTVTRGDSRIDDHTALEQWIDSKQQPDATPAAASVPTTQPTSLATTPMQLSSVPAKEQPASRSLRQILTENLSQQLNVDADTLEISFSPLDEKVLGLAEPYFKFEIKAGRMWNLGPAWWDVTIFTANENKQVNIRATARAWQTQLIVARPLAAKQILEEADFTQRRVLSDSLPVQPLLSLQQCLGQAAALDLKPGMLMTSRMIDPVPLVKAGQLVTVTLTQGSVQIRSVGRALESGTMGQTIKARNETSRDVFDVTITGPQEAKLGPSADNTSAAVPTN
jgi:flagella basal body P-ring formation protein FlgA